MSKPKQKYRTREEIIQIHNKKHNALNLKFNRFEITKEVYLSKTSKLEKALAKKLGV